MGIFERCGTIMLKGYQAADVRYFSGIEIPEDALLMVKPKEMLVALSPLEDKPNGMRTIVIKSLREAVIKKNIGHAVGVDCSSLKKHDFDRMRKVFPKIVDVSEEISLKRSIKMPAEISKIAGACRITKGVMHEIENKIHCGMAEAEAAELVKRLMRERGCEPAFEPVVASGRNSAVPHHIPSGKIRHGLLVVDIGCKYKGYMSDMSRTFILGKRNKKYIDVCETVLEAQAIAIDDVRDGVACSRPYSAAKGVIDKKYPNSFIHSLGHGIGLEPHEYPNVAGNKDVLRTGMVITIEPGIYINGFGGARFEDTVLVEKNGCRVLTK